MIWFWLLHFLFAVRTLSGTCRMFLKRSDDDDEEKNDDEFGECSQDNNCKVFPRDFWTSTQSLWFGFTCLQIDLTSVSYTVDCHWVNQSDVFHVKVEVFLSTFIVVWYSYSVLDKAGLGKILEDMFNVGWVEVYKERFVVLFYLCTLSGMWESSWSYFGALRSNYCSEKLSLAKVSIWHHHHHYSKPTWWEEDS